MSNKKSNVIKSFNYDSSRMDLGVQFKNGKEYPLWVLIVLLMQSKIYFLKS